MDINDNDPEFEQELYNASVQENAPNGPLDLIVQASDRDRNRTITYKLLDGGHPTNSFSVNEGKVAVKTFGCLKHC